MTDKEQQLYEALMYTIYNKFHGNTDEQDIQRALGRLYQIWSERNGK